MTAQRIIQHIFHQPALSRLSTVELEELVAEYPYFTAARLLLAQKNYEQYPSLHAPAVKKAQLYSNNPHYFFQFVTGELDKTAAAPPVQVESQDFTTASGPVERESEQELSLLPQEREEMQATQLDEPAFSSSFTQETVTDKETEADEQETLVEEAPVPEEITAEEAAIGADVTEAATPSLPDAAFINGEAVPAAAEDTIEEPVAETIENEQVDETLTFASPEITAQITPATNEETVEAPLAAEPALPETSVEETGAGQAAAVPPVDQPGADEEEPIKIFPLEIPEEETTLTFQPLYTDDYFAYKRLKEPSNAEELNEKGMAEMRSFTDWLREMKDSFVKKADKDWYHQQLHRIYVDDEPEVSEAVEKMAMESITLNDDIVSETLAEIWARQHQYQTAIQIYQKLSLLNPNKSAYFAQKIQELQLQQSQTGKN